MSRRTIGSLLVRLGMDTKEADKAIKNFDRNLKNAAKNMEGIGTRMTIGFTVPLVAGMRAAIKGLNEEAQAMKRLEVALGGTSKALLDQAAAYHKTTLFQDDQIISAQAYAAALGHSEAQTKQMTDAAVQLAAGLGIDLNTAMEMLHKTTTGSGRALGQLIPEVKNMTAEQLKSGAAIDLVQEKFQGYAEQLAKTGAGPLEMFNKKIIDIGEELAKTLLPYLEKFAKWLGNTLDAFNKLSDGTKNFIVVAGALVAAAGPLTTYLSLLPRLIKGTLDFGDALDKIGGIKVVGGSVLAIAAGLLGAAATGAFMGDKSGLFDAIEQRGGKELGTWDKLKMGMRLGTGLNTGYGASMQAQAMFMESGYSANAGSAAGSPFWPSTKSPYVMVQQTKTNKLPPPPKPPKAKPNTIALGTGWDFAFSPIDDQFASPFTNTMDGMAAAGIGGIGMGGIDMGAFDNMKNAMVEMKEIAPDIQATFERQDDALKSLGDTYAQVSGVAMSAFDAMAQAILNGENAFAAFGKAALMAAGDIAKAAIVSASLKAIEDSVTKFGVVGIAVGAAAAVGLISLMQGLIGKVSTPKLAQGGLAYGPTMAMVGDNPNANIDPEVISPLSKLKSMIQGAGSQTVQVVGVIRGDDILLQTSRANNYAIRRGAGNAISF